MTLENIIEEWSVSSSDKNALTNKISKLFSSKAKWRKTHFDSYIYNERSLSLKTKKEDKKHVFYILEVLLLNGSKGYKIGITSRSVKERYSKEEQKQIKIIKEDFSYSKIDILIAERTIKRILKGKEIIKETNPLLSGHTETYNIDKNRLILIYNKYILDIIKKPTKKQLTLIF